MKGKVGSSAGQGMTQDTFLFAGALLVMACSGFVWQLRSIYDLQPLNANVFSFEICSGDVARKELSSYINLEDI